MMESKLAFEQICHTLDLVRSEIRGLREEVRHSRELIEQRLALVERQSQDHEIRLRDATQGVTQFRLWSSLSNGGSAVMSIAALIKSFLS